MTQRGITKPSESSAAYTIWGTDIATFQRDDEYLNDPTRKRRASSRDARKTQLERKVDQDLEQRLGPMRKVKA